MQNLDFVPEHLRPFIAQQDASLYTPIDHASWRFIMRIARDYFEKNAHQKYLDGIRETGISTERIPLIEEMDARLSRFGWRAVAVSGFIPPAAFLEFQSLGILPIACEMRTLEHLAYTPAPDIVHEAAGHAPIISDPEYAHFLRSYGEISRKAIFSSQDMDVYEAIRNLSVVKEDPASTEADVQKAQQRLDQAVANSNYDSEATLLTRMAWWTTEYGLVGSMEDPKIYGAGLLSSVGESYKCLGPDVRRIPLTVDCINTSYDITKPQPQLLVAENFQRLETVLREFEKTMAFRLGGSDGLAKALQAGTVTTTELDTGIQISGVVAEYRTDSSGDVTYVRMKGNCQLAYRDHELSGHGPEYHREGYSTALGPVTLGGGIHRSPAVLSDEQIRKLPYLEFQSGITVKGTLTSTVRQDGTAIILTFHDCTVSRGEEILYRPEWGPFDLACGSKVVSVFGGAADRSTWQRKTGELKVSPIHPKVNLTEKNRELNRLASELRAVRESKQSPEEVSAAITRLNEQLSKTYPDDWLLRMELLELIVLRGLKHPSESALRGDLNRIAKTSREVNDLIQRGLSSLGRV